MNKHLNIFTTYTKKNRVFQLENDLTRALAICLQEDTLFFNEVLKSLFNGSDLYNQLFEDLDSNTTVQIEIQKKTSEIAEFEKVFAVSLSESSMSDFWRQNNNSEYDPICDLVITINDILIIIEAKRDNIDCTAQLYNQILNIYSNQNKNIKENKPSITPFDLNWKKLMAIAVKVSSFEKTTKNTNRFLTDFIHLVKAHNFSWLPETPIGSLKAINTKSIYRRVESALTQFCKNNAFVDKLPYNDRLGSTFSQAWASELLFEIDSKSGDLVVSIYPGNTKGQGYHIFDKDPKFNNQLKVANHTYLVNKCYHIKFMGQSYITGLWLNDKDFSKDLYTKENFNNFTGRIKRNAWESIEDLLDKHINIDWKSECNWTNKIINSNRSQFDISFGYECYIHIPFNVLASLDKNQSEISMLSELIENIYKSFETDLIQS